MGKIQELEENIVQNHSKHCVSLQLNMKNSFKGNKVVQYIAYLKFEIN